jgi:hypothetical protein
MNETRGEYNFDKDLIKGEAGEDEIVNYMVGLGFEFVSRNNDNRYDAIMKFDSIEYKYEFKTDMYCAPKNDTKNLVVEIRSRGKDSGITVTEADYFVTYYPHLGEIWNIKTSDLKKLIEENNIKLKEGAGDPNSNTVFHLVHRPTYRKHFKVHTIVKV